MTDTFFDRPDADSSGDNLSPTDLRSLRLGELLAEAIEAPPEEREEFLASVCDDPSLIAEALELLRLEEESDGFFLKEPAVRIDDLRDHFDPGAAEQSQGRSTGVRTGDPEQIGPYRLLTCLGEGGMGRVYLAEQKEPVERRVALKLALHLRASHELRRRFLLERKALGRLAHPNIARLYEAGTTEDGHPFVAMELVDGPRITEYCDQKNLSIADRLRLFIDVCLGTQHAHQKQILHRDLKPSNILVDEIDGKPVAKVIDFGIAKALDHVDDRTLVTGDRIIGTPRYMSPEALQKATKDDLDTRADVYSLGVVLYELTTGIRPYRSQSSDLPELIREILGGEPTAPSERLEDMPEGRRYRLASVRSCDPEGHRAELQGDLDWIILKAMSLDREQRYGSAAELADELQRVLEHQPIRARSPSRRYRVEKWMRRNRLTATLAALTTGGLLLAVVATTSALVRVSEAEERSRRDAEMSEQTLSYVVEIFRSADQTVDEMTARGILEEGVQRLREEEISPQARAMILHTLADVHGNLGLFPQAKELAGESLKIRQGLSDAEADVLQSMELLGNLERRAGRLDEAESLLEEVLTAAEKIGDPPRLADAFNSLANLRWRQERFEEAETLHRRALELRRESFGENHEDTAASYNNVGVLLWSRGRQAEAEPELRRAAEIFENLHGPMHVKVADARGNLGLVLNQLSRYAESEQILRRTLEIYRARHGEEHPRTATASHNLAVTLRAVGRYEDAAQLCRTGWEIRRRSLGDDHVETLKSVTCFGLSLWRQGRHEEAEEVLMNVVEAHRDLAPDASQSLRARLNLAIVRRDAGRLTEAEAEMWAVLEARKRKPAPAHRIALTLHHLGVLVALDGRADEAESLLLESLEVRALGPSPSIKHSADTHLALGDLYRSEGRDAEARERHLRALELFREVLPEGHPDRSRAEIAAARL